MIREHKTTKKEFKDTIANVKGLSDAQKKKFIEISEQVSFKQYAMKSNLMLNKIVKTVKKQVKEWYNKKGEKIDKRGELKEPIKKGTTKKELEDKIKKEAPKEKPIVITNTGKSQNLQAPKEVREKVTKKKTKEYRKVYNQKPEVKEANRIRKAKEYQMKKQEKMK